MALNNRRNPNPRGRRNPIADKSLQDAAAQAEFEQHLAAQQQQQDQATQNPEEKTMSDQQQDQQQADEISAPAAETGNDATPAEPQGEQLPTVAAEVQVQDFPAPDVVVNDEGNTINIVAVNGDEVVGIIGTVTTASDGTVSIEGVDQRDPELRESDKLIHVTDAKTGVVTTIQPVALPDEKEAIANALAEDTANAVINAIGDALAAMTPEELAEAEAAVLASAAAACVPNPVLDAVKNPVGEIPAGYDVEGDHVVKKEPLFDIGIVKVSKVTTLPNPASKTPLVFEGEVTVAQVEGQFFFRPRFNRQPHDQDVVPAHYVPAIVAACHRANAGFISQPEVHLVAFGCKTDATDNEDFTIATGADGTIVTIIQQAA